MELSASESVSFYRSIGGGNAVCWSKDERVAVAATDAVYVLTLTRPTLSESKVFKDDSTSVTLSSSHLGKHPHVTVSFAPTPLRDSLPPLSTTDVCPKNSVDECSFVEGVDPVFSDKGVDLVRRVQWSPVGCSVAGGCVLTVVTESGRVLLYTPPASTGLKWKLVDCSSQLSTLLQQQQQQQQHSNDKETPATTEIISTNGDPQQKKNGSKQASNSKDTGSKKSKKATKGSKAPKNDQSDLSVDGPRPKRSKLSSMSFRETVDAPVAVERLDAAVATCAWLPTFLATPDDGGFMGVIAVTTRLGRVALVGVKLPVSEKTCQNKDNLFLIGQHKVSLIKPTKPATSSDGWCSSLLWLPAPSSFLPPPTSAPSHSPPLPPSYFSFSSDSSAGVNSAPHHTHLMVGCTTGLITCLSLAWRGVAPVVGNDVIGCYGNKVSVAGCACDVKEVTAVVDKTTPIWAEPDSIPVHCMACHSRFSKDDLWVAWAKSSVVVATRLSSSYDPVGKQVQVSGQHKTMITGISSLSPSSFVSSSSEGVVQTFTLKPGTTNATPTSIAMDTPSGGRSVSQGLAASENGLLVVTAMNIPGDYMKLSRSGNKFSEYSKVCFNVVASEYQVEELLKNQPSSDWDVCEYLRRYYAERRVMPPQIKELWSTLTKGRSMAFPKLRLLLHANIIMGKKDEMNRCRKEIMKRHVVHSLRKWGEWEKKKDSAIAKKGSKSKDKDKDADRGGVADSLSNVSLQIMAGWLLSVANNICITDNRLAKKILEDNPAKEAQILEACPACGDPVPITNHEYDMCRRGHRWGRCGLTMMLAADSHCGTCLQCGSIANNLSTVSSPPGTWLHKLLLQHSCCIFCGGFYEQVV